LLWIKLPAGTTVPAVHFGNSKDVARGRTVYALGNPFGFDSTLTSGLKTTPTTSYRNITLSSRNDIKAIQHSAPINPGNSGGALFAIQTIKVAGKTKKAPYLIGSNVAMRNESNGAIDFAIPAELAQPTLADVARARPGKPHGISGTTEV